METILIVESKKNSPSAIESILSTLTITYGVYATARGRLTHKKLKSTISSLDNIVLVDTNYQKKIIYLQKRSTFFDILKPNFINIINMAAWIIPAISALAQVAGSALNSGSSMNQASKQRAQNMELAKYSYQKDTEMWNKANEYNNPINQMSRLKEANLNPNLVYGSGTVVGNTSTQTPKFQRPEVPRGTMKLDIPNAVQMLSQFQDYKNKGVQHDNLEVQTDLMQQESKIRQLQQLKIVASTAKTEAERKKIEGLYKDQLQLLKNQTKHERLKMNITNKDWENYKDNNLRPQDPIIWRKGLEMKDSILKWLQQFRKNGPYDTSNVLPNVNSENIKNNWNYIKNH